MKRGVQRLDAQVTETGERERDAEEGICERDLVQEVHERVRRKDWMRACERDKEANQVQYMRAHEGACANKKYVREI